MIAFARTRFGRRGSPRRAVAAITASLAVLTTASVVLAGHALAGPETGATFSTLGTTTLTGSTQCANANAKFNYGAGTNGDDGPTGIAIASSGRLFVVDDGGQRVLSWPNADSLATCAVADEVIGAGQLQGAEAITVGPDNTLYIADTENQTVKIFKPSGAGVYPATPSIVLGASQVFSSAQNRFGDPRGVALTAQGQLAVADDDNNRIQIFAAPFTNGESATISLTGNGAGGSMANPKAVAVSGNSLFVADFYNQQVERFTGPFTTTGGPYVADAEYNTTQNPVDLTVNSTGSLLVTELDQNGVIGGDVAVFPAATSGGSQTHAGSHLTFGGQTIVQPLGIAVDAAGRLFWADFQGFRVMIEDPGTPTPGIEDGSTITTLGTTTPTGLTQCADANARFNNGHGDNGPTGIAISSSGRLFVIDDGGQRVLSWPNADSLATCAVADTVIASGLQGAEAITVGPDDTLYIADTENQTVKIYKPNTSGAYPASPSVTLGSPQTFSSASNRFGDPRGLALTAQGQLAVADDDNNRIQIFNTPFTTGMSATYSLTGNGAGGSMANPKAVAVSGNSLFVADFYNQQVERFTGPFTASSSTVTARYTVNLNPVDLTVVPSGSLLVTELDQNGVLGGDVAVYPSATTGGNQGAASDNYYFGGQTIVQPLGIAVDAAGRLFWADYQGLRVMIETPKPAGPAITHTTVSASPTSSTYGDTVTFTASVSVTGGAAAAGSVQFTVSNASNSLNNVPVGPSIPVVNGMASYSYNGLPVGDADNITAFFTPTDSTKQESSAGQLYYSVAAGAGLTVSGASPNVVQQGVAKTVVITGTNFGANTSVAISGTGVTAGSYSVVDSSHLSVKLTPSATAAPGARDITVNRPAMSATCTGCLTVVAAPKLTAVSPAVMGAGATETATFTGSNFAPGAVITFSVATVTAKVTNVTPTAITATVTVNVATKAGAISARVTNPDSGTVVCTGCLTITPYPVIGTLSHTSLQVGATVPVTLSGSQFQAGATLTFGPGVTATVTNVTSTAITATFHVSPTAATGAVAMRVTNPDGGTARCSCFSVTAGPTVTAVSPATIAHGTTVNVTISGSHFAAGATVTINNVVVSNVVVVSSSSITATFKVSKTAPLVAEKVVVTNTAAAGGGVGSKTCVTID
ncbi:Ig-like domain repeat protein [Jatrophihabitans sp.]|uniref:IPT/TIG domain-containing protein n=1 Tax=Jatrophihabitans sp. TaxID=1932789 RepID=UPI0030C68EEA|nr:glycoside hydrolase family 26 [Jatrophihabitans sp.]